ncbi:MAG: hypothetical protein HOY71_12735, partial [Nonomuraea sp.]|nr:hypothetical protein [Nonomuraea sp.]
RSDQLTVDAPVPVKDGMKITMLGYDQALTWRVEGGKLIVDVPAEARAAGKYVWTFKIDW